MFDSIKIPGIVAPLKLRRLSYIDFEGMPPLRTVLEVSPRQAGSEVVDTFYDTRKGTLQLQIHKDDKARYLNMFSPDRASQFETPFIYVKNYDGGDLRRGNDGITIGNTGILTSVTGRFVDIGGLQEDSYITIDGLSVRILQQYSDSVIIVDHTFAETVEHIQWEYVTGHTTRELEFHVKGGLNFIRTTADDSYTIEAIDIIAGNPFWLGSPQAIVWFDVFVGSNKRYPLQYQVGEIYDIFIAIEDVDVFTASDVFIRPTITIDGSMTYFRMDNYTQNTYITYNAPLASNEYVIINLSNATAIKYPQEENVLKLVGGDITTLGLLPNVVNELHVDSDSITETSRTAIVWRNHYLGS